MQTLQPNWSGARNAPWGSYKWSCRQQLNLVGVAWHALLLAARASCYVPLTPHVALLVGGLDGMVERRGRSRLPSVLHLISSK